MNKNIELASILVDMYVDFSGFLSQMESVGIELIEGNDNFRNGYSTLEETIFDVIGIPKEGEIAKGSPFCRDYISDELYKYSNDKNREDSREFIENLLVEMSEYIK